MEAQGEIYTVYSYHTLHAYVREPALIHLSAHVALL